MPLDAQPVAALLPFDLDTALLYSSQRPPRAFVPGVPWLHRVFWGQMLSEPMRGEPCNGFEGTRFFEKMRGMGHNPQFLDTVVSSNKRAKRTY
jgi:hypothetical protein